MELLRVMQVLGRDGLIVRQIAADDENQLRADPVGQGQRGSGEAERLLEADRRGRVTQPSAGIDVRRTRAARQLLETVVRLVRDAAARQKEAHVVRCCRAHGSCAELDRGLPRDARKPGFARAAQERIGDAPEPVQLFVRKRTERLDICQRGIRDRPHGVEAQQLQA
jgi:hypothetical protein